MNMPDRGYYRKVPAEQLEQFMRFRTDHPIKTYTINGTSWEYLTAGDASGYPVLLLPGALSTADSAWRTISLLEQKGYHIITPGYPPDVQNMSGLADGVAEILRHEAVQSVSVVGGSYGGMLAQVFTHRHAHLVTHLILSHTYPPVARRAKSVEPALRLFRWLPMPMVKKMLRDRMIGILPPRPSPELLLIAAQVREVVNTRLTRQAALSTYLRMMDFDRQVYTPIDLSGWSGKTLIMLAEDDPTTPENLRNDLIALYQGAKVHLFKGSGHATGILESSEYISVIDEFLQNV